MALLQACLVEKHLHIVAKLGTTNDTVIAEQHTLALQHRLVRNQLHLGYQWTHALVAWSKAARPCRSILGNTALVRHTLAGSITHRHTRTWIRNTAAAVYLHIIGLGEPWRFIVGLGEIKAVGKTRLLYILALVGRCRESVVNPEERANLHLLVSRTNLLHAISFNLHDFAWSYLICCFIIEIRERGGFAGSRIGTFLLADDDWSTSPTVTRTDNAILGKDHHGAGTFDVMESFSEWAGCCL